MDIERARFNMIEKQIRSWNVLDKNALDTFFHVKREYFVPKIYRNLAFADLELPLPSGKKMLAPKIEARILQELDIKNGEIALEVGAGSGFMAALLAYRIFHVLAIEYTPILVEFAQKNLQAQMIKNVEVIMGNGIYGWADKAPYDIIVMSGSLPTIPGYLLEQLKIGGRLSVFVGNSPIMKAKIVRRISKNQYQIVNLFETYVDRLLGGIEKSNFRF